MTPQQQVAAQPSEVLCTVLEGGWDWETTQAARSELYRRATTCTPELAALGRQTLVARQQANAALISQGLLWIQQGQAIRNPPAPTICDTRATSPTTTQTVCR